MAKVKKPKKEKPIYDENGRWVEERGRVKGAIRRSFRMAPQMKDALKAARVELSPALKKDGTPGKKPRVRFKCAICGELFPMKQGRTSLVQVDHLLPVVPLWETEKNMTYDSIIRGIYCSADNLQVLCSTPLRLNNNQPSCHSKKTKEENYIRKQLNKITDLKSKSKKQTKDLIEKNKKEYHKQLKEKEEKANARKERKSRKR